MEFVDSLLTNMLDLAKTQAGKLELEVKRSVLAQSRLCIRWCAIIVCCKHQTMYVRLCEVVL